jgi:hypothetical protein
VCNSFEYVWLAEIIKIVVILNNLDVMMIIVVPDIFTKAHGVFVSKSSNIQGF